MRIPRIYTPQTLSSNSEITLENAAAHHLATVLRTKPGRPLVLFNGLGGEYDATLIRADKKQVSVAVASYRDKNTESALTLELGVCLIKNDRFDWLLQKATELGVNKITPLTCDFSDVKLPAERIAKKQQHWQHIIINACEQSGRTALATINTPTTLTHWLQHNRADDKRVLHPGATQALGHAAAHSHPPASIALLVGPEGGFSEKEIAQAQNHHFTPISLGPRILRAETAPLAAVSILQHCYGDLS
ncbi:MAG: 16S rRNA (uracil(1498)-N(3))-methyltransferase [Cellvibrionaceae bacterium]|nr:16S rRNA (uracil(1498)-N(3))-methyltransferase [Cellvibrionaceae bacterium]